MSKNFEKVKRFYDNGIWNEARVYNAVGKWITKEEYNFVNSSLISLISKQIIMLYM